MLARQAFIVVLLAGLIGCDRSGPTIAVPLPAASPRVEPAIDAGPEIDYEAALNDRLGKGVTPERNANVLLRKAIGPAPDGTPALPAEFYKRLGMDEPPKDGAYFVWFRVYARDQLRLDPAEFEAVTGQQSRAARRAWSAADYPHVAGWLTANEGPLALVVEATKRPDYFNPIVARRTDGGREGLLSVNLAGVHRCRELSQALSARALLRVGEGKAEAGWQDLLACHRLGRLISHCGTLIEALVGAAVEQTANQASLAYLAHAKLTTAQIQGGLKDLQSLAPMRPLADKLDLGERSFYLDSLQRVRQGKDIPGGPEKLRSLGAIDWAPALEDGNRWYDRLVAALRFPDRPDRLREIEKVNADFKAAGKGARPANLSELLDGGIPPDQAVGKAIGHVLSGTLFPAAGKVQDAFDRVEQGRRNVRVAFALAAYRAEHGLYPAEVRDLAPKYLPAIPEDLFSGQPLTYRPSADGYLLYSVGVNSKDESGRGPEDDPRGDDLTVRMPQLAGIKEGKIR